VSERASPIVPMVLYIAQQHHPWRLAAYERLSIRYHTPSTVALDFGTIDLSVRPMTGKKGVAKQQTHVYCLADDAAWERVQQTRAELQSVLDALADGLRQLGSYTTRLEEAGSFKRAPNPLCPSVISAPHPDETDDGWYTTYPVPRIERRPITSHTPKMLRGPSSYGSYEHTFSQRDHFVCTDDAAWERIQTLHTAAQEQARAWEALLIELGTYKAALADGRYRQWTSVEASVKERASDRSKAVLVEGNGAPIQLAPPATAPPPPRSTWPRLSAPLIYGHHRNANSGGITHIWRPAPKPRARERHETLCHIVMTDPPRPLTPTQPGRLCLDCRRAYEKENPMPTIQEAKPKETTPEQAMLLRGDFAMDTAPIAFDYAGLDAETRIVVQQKTDEIRERMRRAAQEIVEIGERLIAVQQRLLHGQWEAWLRCEFDWSDQTARRFMHVARAFGGKQQIVAFAPSALYALAAPATPQAAREEALARAEAGQAITYTVAQQLVEQHRPEATAEGKLPEESGIRGANRARAGAGADGATEHRTSDGRAAEARDHIDELHIAEAHKLLLEAPKWSETEQERLYQEAYSLARQVGDQARKEALVDTIDTARQEAMEVSATPACEQCGRPATTKRTIGGLLAWRCQDCAALAVACDRAEQLGATIDYTAERTDGRLKVLPPDGEQQSWVWCNAAELGKLTEDWERHRQAPQLPAPSASTDSESTEVQPTDQDTPLTLRRAEGREAEWCNWVISLRPGGLFVAGFAHRESAEAALIELNELDWTVGQDSMHPPSLAAQVQAILMRYDDEIQFGARPPTPSLLPPRDDLKAQARARFERVLRTGFAILHSEEIIVRLIALGICDRDQRGLVAEMPVEQLHDLLIGRLFAQSWSGDPAPLLALLKIEGGEQEVAP
jgi:hypothetical protein